MKAQAKMNNIDEELDYISLSGSVISVISDMEHISDDTWNIGLEYNKHGDRLGKSNCI